MPSMHFRLGIIYFWRRHKNFHSTKDDIDKVVLKEKSFKCIQRMLSLCYNPPPPLEKDMFFI